MCRFYENTAFHMWDVNFGIHGDPETSYQWTTRDRRLSWEPFGRPERNETCCWGSLTAEWQGVSWPLRGPKCEQLKAFSEALLFLLGLVCGGGGTQMAACILGMKQGNWQVLLCRAQPFSPPISLFLCVKHRHQWLAFFGGRTPWTEDCKSRGRSLACWEWRVFVYSRDRPVISQLASALLTSSRGNGRLLSAPSVGPRARLFCST